VPTQPVEERMKIEVDLGFKMKKKREKFVPSF
jgi:hypothetical protein